MKKLSRVIKFFSVMVLLLLLALLAFVATFDANNYKPQFIQQVQSATGRTFNIEGDVSLSLFPWIGLKVDNAWLGNAKGFHAEKFAAIEQLDIKINVLPLLKKEVEINTIRLHGLNVSLEVAKDQSNNWSDLSKPKSAEESAVAEESPKPSVSEADVAPASMPLKSLKVEGFEFVDARIVYDDRSSGAKSTISALNLKTTAIQFNQKVEVSFSAHVENNKPQIDTRLKLTTQLTFDEKFSVINLDDLVFTVVMKANEFVKQDEEIEFKASVGVLMESKRATVKHLQLSALGTTTVAEVVVSDFLQTPQIKASVEVKTFDARAVAQRAGVVLPAMAKPDALKNVGLKTNIQLQGNVLEANDFVLVLDDSTLSGWVHVLDLAKQQLRYELAFDHLNIDNYLPPVPETPAVEAISAAAVVASTGDEKIVLPLEMLRQLDVQGDFRIATLVAMKYDITQFLMTTKVQKGEISIKPLSLQVLQGQLTSSVNMNVSQAMPVYAIDLDAKALQVGTVANPFLKGIMGEKPLTMEGAADLSVAIKTAGETINQLKKASLGEIILGMKQTEVDGFDPEFFMRSSVANYLNSKGFGLSKTIMGNYTPREVTVFDTIRSTVKLATGIADTQDFLMDSKRVQVAAKGHTDLLQNTLDVISSVKLVRGQTALEKVLDEPLFVHVHGPFAALEYDLDTERLKKSTTGALEGEARAKLDAEKQRAQEKLDAEKAQLKARADEERRLAEEKAKLKLNDKTDQYKDKLKDKLKGLF